MIKYADRNKGERVCLAYGSKGLRVHHGGQSRKLADRTVIPMLEAEEENRKWD